MALCAVDVGVTRRTWISGRLITTACVAVGRNTFASAPGGRIDPGGAGRPRRAGVEEGAKVVAGEGERNRDGGEAGCDEGGGAGAPASGAEGRLEAAAIGGCSSATVGGAAGAGGGRTSGGPWIGSAS